MTKKPALGRGLSALIPSSRPADSDRTGAHVQMVELDRLEANRRQPRKNFDEQGLAELARSISETGILQPILVTRHGDRFRILAGERRVRAAALAGLQRIPVLVRDGLEDRDELLVMLIENVQRKDLTPLEEAEAFRQLRDEFGMTQEGVAEKVGKDRATVANTLRLLKLPQEVRTALEEGLLSAGHARALLALPSAADQEKVAREAIKEGLSVRLTEARVAALTKDSPAAIKKRERKADPDTRDAERRLERALSTKVEIRRRKKGGEVRITFFSEDQLIGLFERLVKEEG
ncbi:MAG TPA: ParB/RepB/Spo0J family partition protein [Thermoanaerobaculia bacterium]